jgi:hypothetical protein
VPARVKLVGVRVQYSFWPGESGLDAWDVAKLIELGSGLAVENVALSTIGDVERNYWFSDYWEPTVRAVVEHVQLILDADPSYPILLAPDGRVMDGMHRIAAALLRGDSTIAAVRLPALPPPDYHNCTPGDLPY